MENYNNSNATPPKRSSYSNINNVAYDYNSEYDEDYLDIEQTDNDAFIPEEPD